ncbi:glycoside hydrolase family 51 protein [Schizophyllum commune]
MSAPTILVDPARVVDDVDPRIYSGFTEHMGRCIYGGIYEPENQHGLADPKTGFRTDVMEVLKELKIPVVRYPGGNFVSSYRWQDGIGPKELRPRRPELAWLNEESNQFGTDEFIDWCRALGTEPYICLNMGTGTLEDALAWVEYCNSSANTYYANLRRKNGHEQPHNVKVSPFSLSMEAQDYAKKAYQWAKALRLLDPNIKIIACGETGYADWDRVVLKKLAPVVDYHSIHIYTVSEGKHEVNVMGPAAAEQAINITKSLIDLAKIENDLSKEITVISRVSHVGAAPGEDGAEEKYDLSDALAVASWLNVFVRKADVVKIACIAQSIITSPEGLFKQTTYYPLHLFTNLMRGASLDVYVTNPSPDDAYTGLTTPAFVQKLTKTSPDSEKLTKYVDVSAVVDAQASEVRVAIVNRHAEKAYEVPVKFGADTKVASEVKVYEVWSEDLRDKNTFGEEKVKTVEKSVKWEGKYNLKAHSFQVLVFKIEA